MMRLAKGAYRIILARLFNKITPLFVHINVTNKCNLSCGYCFNRNNNKKDTTFDNYQKIIDILSKSGNLKVTITGGEPFYRKDIQDFIIYAKKRIPYVFITTNGTLFKKDMDFVSYLDGLTFSINEAYAKNYDRLLFENIKIAKGLVRNVFIQSNLDEASILNLDKTFAFSKENNISVVFNPVKGEQGLSKGMLRSAIERIISAKKDNYPILNSFTYLKYLLSPEPQNRCFAGKLFFYIDSDANIARCIDFCRRDKRYNLLDQNFKYQAVNFNNECNHCGWQCYQDLNFLLSFKPEAVGNLFFSHYSKKVLL